MASFVSRVFSTCLVWKVVFDNLSDNSSRTFFACVLLIFLPWWVAVANLVKRLSFACVFCVQLQDGNACVFVSFRSGGLVFREVVVGNCWFLFK